MAAPEQTFSESWHRIAGARLALRPAIEVRRVFFRGERWHVIGDPLSNSHFRLRPAAYDFVARLDGRRTIDECWRDCLAANPEDAPGQEEVIQLLAQLHQSNLLRGDAAPDTEALLSRFRKRRAKEIRSRLMSILFIRVPLFDPDDFLRRWLPLAGWLFTRAGFAVWLVVVAFGIKVVIDHLDRAVADAGAVLSPSNLPLLYLAMAGIKVFHEFGHGFACRKFGGPVHVMGVMFLVFTPLPYVDVTSSWRFRDRRERAVVGAAGMYVELMIASVAAWVWASTGPGVVHALAYNAMFIASVSTILFNANPLLRFDGYYILSDWLGIPNLHQRSQRLWRHVAERFLFGIRRSVSPAESARETAALATFGAVAFIYRIVLYFGILLFVAGQFLLVGVILALIGLVTWVVVPAGRLIHYLASSERLARTRGRALAATAGVAAAIVLVAGVVPFPRWFKSPAVVQSVGYSGVFAEAPGMVDSLARPTGSRVSAGDPLVVLRNPELEFELSAARADLEEALLAERGALGDPGVGIDGLRRRTAAARRQLDLARQRLDSMLVRARTSGIWVAPQVERLRGAWVERGTLLGEITDPDAFRLSAVIAQEDASDLFGSRIRSATARLRGQTDVDVPILDPRLIPAERRTLPSAALGWSGGGEIAVKQDQQRGTTTEEPFFELRASIAPAEGLVLHHGLAGKLRCSLPAEPLLPRAIRALRQLLQKRFGL